MKKILLSIFTFLCLMVNAQLDTDHWFAPMAAKAGTNGLQSFLYLSTNEVTPFTVQIFNDNTLFTSVQLSKGNPQQVSIPSNFLLVTSQSDLFTPISKGMYVKGTKKFFANYRFSITNHAEIITSKGLAGLGTKFYAAMAPLTGTEFYINSTIGVTATEDNTNVVISGYNPNVVFSDGSSSATKTFTLNKGQSYVLDAVSLDSTFNLDGLVGAKIESTKPVSVTNGNFNGIYTNFNFSNNDILMDQSVPVERLGKDFVVVKGNGTTTSEMESVLLVATEDNTTFTVNGVASGVNLNAGQHFKISGGLYINQGNGNYNMAISSTKNLYVYQFLAGTSVGNEYATGGMNFIPPLSCFLPNQIDEIGFINKIGTGTYNTKLNIITQTGAVVTLNGAAMPAGTGPYTVNGQPNWVNYSVPNITGTVVVNSTKSVTAGIAAGSGAAGYGGYFAGFSAVPAISKTGDCLNGIILSVDNTYDSYQWYLNGVVIPGATTFSINPELYGAGVYTCLITKNNCDSKLTNAFNYTLCPPIQTVTYNIGSCNTKTITPAFTNSTQTINSANTVIAVQPTNGVAIINPVNGQITYTPNTGIITSFTDTFIYYIEGNGNPADFEYFKVILNINVLQTTNATLTSCAATGSNGIFNLTSAVVSTDLGVNVTYFSNAALTTPITAPSNYSSPGGIVYANVTSSFGCTKVAQITLTVNPSPNINTANYNANICDDDLDGIINVNFATVTPQIVTNSTNFLIKYYLNQTDATAGNNNTLPANWSYTTNITVYVRVESLTNCPPTFGQINFTIGSKIVLSTLDFSTLVCDANSDGTETVNLDNYKNNFTTDPAVTLTYYNTLANAQSALNPIGSSQIIAPSQVFYIRFQNANGCPNIAKLTLSLDQIVANNSTLSSCANANASGIFNLTTTNTTPTAGAVITYFSDSALTIPITAPTNYSSTGGTVYANVTSPFGCMRVAQITLVVNPATNINTANFNANLCDDNFDGIILVNFNTVTPQIVTNSGNFLVKYYLLQADATAGNANSLPLNWTYTVNTIVYVRVESLANCPPTFGQINFTIGAKIPLITNIVNTQVCDTSLDATESVNLNDFKNQFTADPAVTLSFHATLANAQAGTNPISNIQTITSSSTFYVRFTSNTSCPNTGTLTIALKFGKKSDTLRDQIVCSGEKATLNAGPGFTSYLWSNGATTQSINVDEGVYFVDLTFNGCVYRQNVTVTTAQSPTITSIVVTANNVTINVSGGTAPYQYSLNGIDYQTSNTFFGLQRGPHKVYVLSADGCSPIIKDFLIINLINAITPNADGHNDVLDYSDLSIKENVSIEVIDRYGAMVYKSVNKNYVWDGKSGGRAMSTGTYWYLIKWTEPDTKLPVSYSGWLLIKNRE